jgi:hypothetical protein
LFELRHSKQGGSSVIRLRDVPRPGYSACYFDERHQGEVRGRERLFKLHPERPGIFATEQRSKKSRGCQKECFADDFARQRADICPISN